MKPNNTPMYVNRKSNHPPSIIKNIPAAVNRRLNSISADDGVFKEAIKPYQDALDKSGYEHQLKYDPPSNPTIRNHKRSRKITWFNPPFSQNVSTHVGAKFLQLIDTCFPKDNPLRKIINRNTVKVAYRTMPNMKQILSMHNSKVRYQEVEKPPPGCNCRGGRAVCPLQGACLTEGVIYEAKVTRLDNNTSEFYTGVTVGTFKQRYYGHYYGFRHRSQRTSSCLSSHIWDLKDAGVDYNLFWKVIARVRGFNPTTRSCQACLKEKYYIMFRPEGTTLNNRSEFYNTCRHRKKLLLEYA